MDQSRLRGHRRAGAPFLSNYMAEFSAFITRVYMAIPKSALARDAHE